MVAKELHPCQRVPTSQDLVIEGIRECVKHHSSRGTRTIVAEILMKNISTACLFKIEKDKIKVTNNALKKKDKIEVTNNELEKLLGIHKNQLTKARTRLKDILTENKLISPLERKVRKDFIQIKLEPFVFDFL